MRLKTIFVPLFLIAGCLLQAVCLAALPAPAENGGRIEAVVIQVDRWAVYVPNRVFYFDTHMSKSKREKLASVANQLRNKEALISYHLIGADGKDERAVLSDIVPAVEQENGETPSQEAVEPPGGTQGNASSKISEPEEQSAEPLPSPISDAQVAAFVEALRLAAPQTANPDDGLYSAWKIKAENIRRWSQQCTGTSLSPAQFTANTQEARQILACIMGKILREQYAITGDVYVAVLRAASWWLTGDPAQYDSPRTDAYTQKVLGLYMRLDDPGR